MKAATGRRTPQEEELGECAILVAEDDVRLADILVQSLTEAGWEVEVAHDGRQAFDAALAASVSPVGPAAVRRPAAGLDAAGDGRAHGVPVGSGTSG